MCALLIFIFITITCLICGFYTIAIILTILFLCVIVIGIITNHKEAKKQLEINNQTKELEQKNKETYKTHNVSMSEYKRRGQERTSPKRARMCHDTRNREIN